MFSNSPLLHASNIKHAKMYKLQRGILRKKTGGSEGLSKTDRGLKTQGLYKFVSHIYSSFITILLVFKLYLEGLILVIV